MEELQHNGRLVAELFDAQPQPVFWSRPIRQPDGTITDFEYAYCNEEMYRYSGMSPDQLIGKGILHSPVLSTELQQKFIRQITLVYESGEKVTDTVYNPLLNKYYSFLRSRIQDGVLTVLQDRTEEYRMIRQLEQQKRLLDNVLQHSPSGITVTEVIRDAEGKVVDGRTLLANEAADRFTGVSPELYTQKTIGEIDPNILTGPLFLLSLQTLETGQPFHTEYFFEPSGKWLELSVARMDNNHLINVFKDITPAKEAQLRQEQLIEELKQTNTNLEEFAYAASHDLKEPIRKINTFLDLLQQKLGPRLADEELRLVQRMEHSARRMSLLVEDLLIYSQVSQETALQEEVNLHEKVRLVLVDLELLVEEKAAVVAVGALPVVRGHRRQLQQLFQNLIGNALKYSRPGVPPRVAVTCRTAFGRDTGLQLSAEEMNRAYHLIEVTDNGIGFDQADAEKIFNVFQRLHSRDAYAGTGVGLAIARKVVRNHNGFITAQSAPGQGATFRVLLPVS